MSEPRRLTLEQIKRIHAEQLAIFGGPAGIRDEGLLETAIALPLNKFHHGETDFAALAAAYAFGLARNHPFVDGNKRAAFAAMMVFMRSNGVPFKPTQAAATRTFYELAAGVVSEAELSAWIARNSPS